MSNKIIQKNITFRMNLAPFFWSSHRVLFMLKKNYEAKVIKRSWRVTSPFRLRLEVELNVKHDIDIEKMRNVQHDLFFKTKKGGIAE